MVVVVIGLLPSALVESEGEDVLWPKLGAGLVVRAETARRREAEEGGAVVGGGAVCQLELIVVVGR